MTNTLLIKRSSTANAAPTAGQLEYGELAINYRDGNLFYKNNGNQVVVIASNQVLSVSGNVTGGNINTSGQVNATSALIGNVLITDDVITPVTYDSYGVGDTGTLTVNGNLDVTGNVTGDYFIGNGSQLTGIVASGGTSIDNGTSNVSIGIPDGNVEVAVNGVANSVQFGQASLYVQGPISTPKILSVQSIMQDNVNGVMISPVTIASTGNIFVPSGSTLTIFTPA